MKKISVTLLPLLISACVFQQLFEPTPDPAIAATETAQEALMQSIEATLSAIPTITPAGDGKRNNRRHYAAHPVGDAAAHTGGRG